MSFMRREWPEVGDLIVATVKNVENYGVYVTLDEYVGKEGLLHISEISSRWVRNIRNHVREKQKVVLQVLRVNPTQKHIDLSLRRVNQDERRKKIEDWKKNRKAETLLKSAAASLKITEDKIYSLAAVKIEKFYGTVYAGLEASAKQGAEALTEAGVSKKIAKTLAKIVKDKIVLKGVTIHGVFEITSMEPRGVEEIKETFLNSKKMAEELDVEVQIYSLGAPKYRIEIFAEDYRKAESALDKVVTYAKEAWHTHDGRLSFSRE